MESENAWNRIAKNWCRHQGDNLRRHNLKGNLIRHKWNET